MSLLSSKLRIQFQTVLTHAFDRTGLVQLARVRLVFGDVRFEDAVDFDKPTNDIAFQMVKVAEQYAHEHELARAIQAERPNREDAAGLVVEVERAASGNHQPIKLPDTVKDAIIRFSVKFQQRRKEFAFLNAYKQLHDILHDLEVALPDIKKAVEATRQAVGARPDTTMISDRLHDWVEQSKQSASATEFPDRPPRWIAKLEQTVNDLTGELGKTDVKTIDLPKVDRSVEVLAQLPAVEQQRLNERLYECALRLDTDDLVQRMESLLAELGPEGQPAAGTMDLRKDVEQVRGLCSQLKRLVDDHDLCQQVDAALEEAVGLPEVTPKRLSQWTQIRSWLQSLADHRPNEVRATRPLESAVQFEDAKEGDCKRMAETFQQLMERFSNLFLHVDKTLLEVTRDLIYSVQLLDRALQGIK